MEELPDDPLWFKDAIIYEIHIRAFQDSTNDGIGDLNGLISRLDYLADRHESAHPRLEPDPEADAVALLGEDLREGEQDTAVEIIDAVFDCLEAQLSVCLELVTGGELAIG